MAKLLFIPKTSNNTPTTPIQKAINSKLQFQKKTVLPVNPRAIPNQTYA